MDVLDCRQSKLSFLQGRKEEFLSAVHAANCWRRQLSLPSPIAPSSRKADEAPKYVKEPAFQRKTAASSRPELWQGPSTPSVPSSLGIAPDWWVNQTGQLITARITFRLDLGKTGYLASWLEWLWDTLSANHLLDV